MSMDRLREKFEQFKALIAIPDFYNIAAAIRGPDTGNSSLKWIFTARIRYLIGVRNNGAAIRTINKVHIEHVENAVLNLRKGDLHYLDHVQHALTALASLGAIDHEEHWFLYYLADALHIIGASMDSEKKWILNEKRFAYGMNMLLWVINEYKDFIEV